MKLSAGERYLLTDEKSYIALASGRAEVYAVTRREISYRRNRRDGLRRRGCRVGDAVFGRDGARRACAFDEGVVRAARGFAVAEALGGQRRRCAEDLGGRHGPGRAGNGCCGPLRRICGKRGHFRDAPGRAFPFAGQTAQPALGKPGEGAAPPCGRDDCRDAWGGALFHGRGGGRAGRREAGGSGFSRALRGAGAENAHREYPYPAGDGKKIGRLRAASPPRRKRRYADPPDSFGRRLAQG